MKSLLFNDPLAGTGEYFKTNTIGEVALLPQPINWDHCWMHIDLNRLGGSSFANHSPPTDHPVIKEVITKVGVSGF